ncbi:MAG: phosphodiester glycosidase family protein [bacterium]
MTGLEVIAADKRMSVPLISLVWLLVFAVTAQGNWKKLNEGLELGSFQSPHPSASGDSIIRVLRIDPRLYGLRLLNTSANQWERGLSAKEWSLRFNLGAAINASMYQKDHKTSVSLMRRKGHVNNPRLSKDKAVLAFDRKDPGVPAVMIIDRQCDNYQALKKRYRTLIQSIRMISCRGINVWKQHPDHWSTAAFALDNAGNVLFIHVKSPYSTHDLIDILLSLPLGIDRAMYLEGGPQAQLFIQNGDETYEFSGYYSGAFGNSAPSGYAWPIPNIIGVFQKEAAGVVR